MLSEIEKLRRKVFWARLACAVVFVGGLIIFAFSQWLGSDSGLVSNAESQLKRDHTPRTILECLDISERLLRKDNKTDSQKIELAVDSALDIQSMKPADAGKSYLELAHELQKRGSNISASHFAIKALAKYNEASQKSRSNPSDYSEVIEEAANILEGAGKDAQYSQDDLKAMDLRFGRKLLRDAHGEIIGYAYSRKIFVAMRRQAQDQIQSNFVNSAFLKSKAPVRKTAAKTAAKAVAGKKRI